MHMAGAMPSRLACCTDRGGRKRIQSLSFLGNNSDYHGVRSLQSRGPVNQSHISGQSQPGRKPIAPLVCRGLRKTWPSDIFRTLIHTSANRRLVAWLAAGTLLCGATAASRSALASSAVGSTIRACSRQGYVLSKCRNLRKPLVRDPADTQLPSCSRNDSMNRRTSTSLCTMPIE